MAEGGFESLFILCAISGAHKGYQTADAGACNIDGVTATPGCSLDATSYYFATCVLSSLPPQPDRLLALDTNRNDLPLKVIIFHQTNILTNSPFFQMSWPDKQMSLNMCSTHK